MMSTLSQEWSAKITARQQSGMTLAGWCRENSENYHRFLCWRKRLAEPDPGRFLELTAPAAPISLECNGVLVHIQREMGSGAKFRNGDTLLARITPCLENGKSAFVDFLAEGQIGWGSTEFIVLRPKDPLPEYFGYLLCRHPAFREHAVQSMSGTSGRQRVQNDVLGRYLLAIPINEVADAFTEVVRAIQQSIDRNHKTATILASIRDTLLPRLISGHLRLPDVEVLNEDAAA